MNNQTASLQPTEPPAHAEDSALESRYYSFLRANGYITTDALNDVLAAYLPLFEGFEHVADLGCGHGEFLDMLQTAGHRVSGVDLDSGMVARCQALGFDVTLGDAVEWLNARPNHFDAIFSSNVIEHLPADTVRNWVAAAHAALRPGGMLLLTTPNAASLIVQFHEYWRDPTHVRLYSAQLVEFFLADAGFVSLRSFENPAARWEGIDALLANVDDPLAEVAAPLTLVPPPPLPSSPEGGTWRERFAWRVANWTYHKFIEPYELPLRNNLVHVHKVVDEHARVLDTLRVREEQLRARIQAVAAAERFMHPSREIGVLGYKAAANPSDRAAGVSAKPSAPTL